MSNSQIDRALAKQLVKVADNYERMIKAEARVKELEAMPARKEPTMSEYTELAKECGATLTISLGENGGRWRLNGSAIFQKEQLTAFAAKLREKDAVTIAHQKEEIELLNNRLNADSQDFTIQCLRETEKLLRGQLSTTQAREAMLVEAMHSVLCDPEINPCFAGSDGDRQVIARALSNSTEHTERFMAEVKAKTLEDAADELEAQISYSDATAVTECISYATITECVKQLRYMAFPNPVVITHPNQRSQSMNAITKAVNLELKEGEKLAFSITLSNGKTIHTILLPGEEKKNWKDAMKWAQSLGGDLPNRAEQALLFKYMPEEFQPYYYWSNTQHIGYSLSAWCQCFGSGRQDLSKSCVCLARPVRRVTI